jgi:hypothetical protein
MPRDGWRMSILQIMLIESIIEMYAAPCFFTSEHCLSVISVTLYGEDVVVWEGMCLDFNGTIVRHNDQWLKAETRRLINTYLLRLSSTISPGFTVCDAMIEIDFHQSPGFNMSRCLLRSGVRKYPVSSGTTSVRSRVPPFFISLQRQHPFKRCGLGGITGLPPRRVCDYLFTH